MADSGDQNPYRPTGNAEPLRREKSEDALTTTAGERVLMIVIAIVVAIPVFFTTCIGGGFSLMALNIGSGMYGPSESVLIVLSLVCFLLAIIAGYRTSVWFKKRRLAKRARLQDIE